MDKMKFETPDMTAENIEKIAKLFPNCVTEMRDESGKIKRGINFEMLKQMLSPDVVDGDECYEFTWVGKKASVVEANKPIRKTLRPCIAESKDWDTTENLYIEGDNLEVLKLLQESYLGKVKMIYIDPPYNTGNDFVYPDSFIMNNEEYNDGLGYYDKDGNVNFARKNSTSAGKYHSDWCSMMYSRLMLARNLLTDDGVIFISIDDNEQENLKKLCDEVFGESNYICPFIWEKTQHFGRQKLNSYCNNDYILCYAKNLYSDKLKELLVENIKTELQDAPLFNASNNINTLNFPMGCTTFNVADGVYTTTTSNDYELLNPVIVENGKNKNAFSLRFRSRWSNATVQTEILKGTTFWVKTTSFAIRAIYGGNRHSTDAPRQIIFTNSSNPMATKSRFNNRIDTSENASNQLAILMDGSYFSYPKPVSLIEYFITLLYNEKKEDYENDFIVLDFFSGSATTAHAVMQLNAEDGGHRKFIMVQLPEPCDEKSEAYKVGYKNICEIGKERIRRAGELIKENINVLRPVGDEITDYEKMKGQVRIARTQGNGTTGRLNYAANASETFIDINTGKRTTYEYEESDPKDYYRFHPDNLDVGFRVLKLADSNMKDVYYAADDYTQDLLVGLESNIKDDRSELDLLFGCLIDWGLPLSLPYKSEQIEGCTVHTYNDGDLVACFDDNVPESVVKEIAKRKPLRAVFRDSGFADSPSKINVFEIFKLYMPEDADDINKRVRVI